MRTLAQAPGLVAYALAPHADPAAPPVYPLPHPAQPQSVQVWVNGLRQTNVAPLQNNALRLEELRPNDTVLITYQPAQAPPP